MSTKEDIEKKYSSMPKDELIKVLWSKSKEVDRLREVYDKLSGADDPYNYNELANAKREFKKAYEELKVIGALCGHAI